MSLASFCAQGRALERLESFGWNGFFEAHFHNASQSGLCPARVASDFGTSYRLLTEHGELKGETPGRLRHSSETAFDFPSVGDWVTIRPILSEVKAIIQSVLPRKSRFVRKEAGLRSREQVIAANIDTVFVVVALNNDFNLRRIERYVTAIWDSGAAPVLILSKSDLCQDAREHVKAVEAVAYAVPIHPISALTGDGVSELDQYLVPGATVALVGSSGAGKSTLINTLFGSNIRLVREIRANDDRGRHTTSTRDLILLPAGALVLDTPGMRELQLWNAEAGFKETFDEVESLASKCRFTDCSHRTEPGCAVREALESGRLDRGRLESFAKIQKEVEFFALRQRYGAKRAEKKRWKKVMSTMKKRENRKSES